MSVSRATYGIFLLAGLSGYGHSQDMNAFANYVIELKGAADPGTLRYEDENVVLEFGFPTSMRHLRDAGPAIPGITLRIQNKTDAPVKIDWNQISIIDLAGIAKPILHTGIRPVDKGIRMEPTVVPPSATINDYIAPKDNLIFIPSRRVSGYTLQEAGWDMGTLLPMKRSEAQLLLGKTFSVYLPLEVNGKSLARSFTFVIAKVD